MKTAKYSRFPECETEEFYDRSDSFYRSFWDPQGSLHWGYFDAAHETSARPPEAGFQDACHAWSEDMLARSDIGSSATVLDLGCGNGMVSLWLASRTGCRVTGIDVSGVRIANAHHAALVQPGLNAGFVQGSALHLPFPNECFTHVWSQAAFYHVPGRDLAIREAWRTLRDFGVLAFDDLVTPLPVVDPEIRRNVYDRLLFEPGPSHREYLDLLRESGFCVVEDVDLSVHLDRSYALLGEIVRTTHPELSTPYRVMRTAVERRQLGWSFFRAVKVSDPLAWVYQDGGVDLAAKYDHWSRSYDADLADGYRHCPYRAADLLMEYLPAGGAVLDAGCGTGTVGERLAEHGVTDLYGVDFSAGMLRAARAKEIYREVHRHDLTQPGLPYPPGSFEAIICVGLFTFGHLPPSALTSLTAMLAPGGLLLITSRDDYRAVTPEFDARLSALPLEPVRREPDIIFDKEPVVHTVLRKGADP